MSHVTAVKKNQLQQKFVTKAKTICLTMIVRNESKNMIRLLNSVESIIDFISIVDTGSTDNTIDIIQKWYKAHKIPGKVHSEPFVNFGYNRTHSIIKARETFPQASYFLLSDADFIWEVDVCGKFNKKLLFEHKYLVRQNSNNLSYFNIRMLSNEVDWECVGVTHEYWSERKNNRYKGEIKTHSLKTIQINDMEDGGCKSDKFERDKRLLMGDLENPDLEEFLKARYTFYLAQTYKCLGEYENSIIHYKKRIEYGGWAEEVYFSMYQISFNYKAIHDIYKHIIYIYGKPIRSEVDEKYLIKYECDSLEKANLRKQEMFDLSVQWGIDAWKFRPSRTESLYATVSFLREYATQQNLYHRKAYDLAMEGRKIPFTSDTLFVEPNAYQWGFDYEISIVAYYLGAEEKLMGATCCETLLDRDDLSEDFLKRVQGNAKFYT
jgi:glycosyltransferase involved in cell wall biosynthesis